MLTIRRWNIVSERVKDTVRLRRIARRLIGRLERMLKHGGKHAAADDKIFAKTSPVTVLLSLSNLLAELDAHTENTQPENDAKSLLSAHDQALVENFLARHREGNS